MTGVLLGPLGVLRQNERVPSGLLSKIGRFQLEVLDGLFEAGLGLTLLIERDPEAAQSQQARDQDHQLPVLDYPEHQVGVSLPVR